MRQARSVGQTHHALDYAERVRGLGNTGVVDAAAVAGVSSMSGAAPIRSRSWEMAGCGRSRVEDIPAPAGRCRRTTPRSALATAPPRSSPGRSDESDDGHR